MIRAITTNPKTPARQPKPIDSDCPIGAEIMAPSDPAADTMPSTELRSTAGTGREATAMATPEPQQASANPISRPAPSRTPKNPVAVARASIPSTNATAPISMTGRKPKRAAQAPAKGCRTPQARF